jgi:cystathionine beta-lyase
VPGGERAISVQSASKAFNLAGLRAATALAGPDAAVDLRRIPEEAGHAVNHLAVIAHAAAYAHGDDWLDALRAGIVRNRALVVSTLAERAPAVRVHPGDGTYLCWLDVRDAVPAGADPHRHVLSTAKVALGDGAHFGAGGAGWLRLNLATSEEILTEALERLVRALS